MPNVETCKPCKIIDQNRVSIAITLRHCSVVLHNDRWCMAKGIFKFLMVKKLSNEKFKKKPKNAYYEKMTWVFFCSSTRSFKSLKFDLGIFLSKALSSKDENPIVLVIFLLTSPIRLIKYKHYNINKREISAHHQSKLRTLLMLELSLPVQNQSYKLKEKLQNWISGTKKHSRNSRVNPHI